MLPTVFFFCSDCIMGSQMWNWLGPMREVDVSTCEAERMDAFLLRPWCAHSSHAQIAAGCYISSLAISREIRSPLASAYLGMSLVFLGLASYAWWGSRRQAAWLADNVMMEVHVQALALLVISISFPQMEQATVMAGIMMGACRFTNVKKAGADLVFPGLATILVSLYTVHRLGGTGNLDCFAAALALIFIGFTPKVLDVQGAWQYGTSVFHYMEALGFVAFFLWAQTLPSPQNSKAA